MPNGGGKICMPDSIQEKFGAWLSFAHIPVTRNGYQKKPTPTLLKEANNPGPVLLKVKLVVQPL